MDIRTTPTPSQYGTKQLLKEYGDQLVGRTNAEIEHGTRRIT
ncbi:MAG: hypothetical protein RPU64_16750 [Candidatus Sedimenticola sp. (ex Thyasira tokunagai)]